MKAADVEIELVRHLDFRVNLLVPNVSWGLIHWGECDLLSMSAAGFLTEYEIKVSAADIKREWSKARWTNPRHRLQFDSLIKEYYMAVPAKLFEVARDTMPEDIGGGVVVVDYEWPDHPGFGPRPHRVIEAKTNRKARKLAPPEQFKLARLGTMRYWSRLLRQERLKAEGEEAPI